MKKKQVRFALTTVIGLIGGVACVAIAIMDPSAGYGEFRPIAGNDTSGGRSNNRRVEFNIELDAASAKEIFDLRKLGFIFWTPDEETAD